MVAAQLFQTAQTLIPGLSNAFRQGDFSALNAFLGERIWSQGSRYGIEELVIHATGEGLNPSYFERHLRQRYLGQTAH
jgi:carboxypeptidase Taq